MQLLHLDSSIQGDTSVTRLLSAAVVERYRQHVGAVAVDYRDLAATPLPHITLPRFGTEAAEAVLAEFVAADILVLGAPMYNFGIPSQLKSWFDHILVAGKTFRYGAGGVEGLAAAKKAVVVLSRGGVYSEGPAAAMEHAETHLRAMLGFIGIDRPQFIVAEGVAMGDEPRRAAIDAALAAVAQVEDASEPAVA
ncbi:FMN-dependent NADH-azoreductase [Sphingomonas trueperi]|uniref:FMN-dependent NADH-azoreductase n=1 Tax=Sphingomonas trueperi TaxID=53317 RepID=UPI000EACB401